MAAGISTYKTYLMEGTGTGTLTWAKVADIVSFPDLQPAPETIDTTSLSDAMRTYIPGIKDPGGNMTFGMNYTVSNYTAVQALDDGEVHHLAVWFGATGEGSTATPDGSDGKFSFDGYVKPQLTGGGVNEKVSMNLIVTPTTEVTWSTT